MFNVYPALVAGCHIHSSTIDRKHCDMKTHLPVSLRKALLSALIAVSFSDYTAAWAEALESGNITVDKITENTADKTYTTGDGNAQIGSIEISFSKSVEGLTVSALKGDGTDNGNVMIGDSQGTLTNAQITAEGNLTIGQNPQDTTNYLTIKGDEASFVRADGDITFNQSVMFYADESANDKFEMSAGKSIYFHGDETKISSGNNGAVLNPKAKTIVTAAGDVIIDSYKVHITASSVVNTTNKGNIVVGRQFSVNQVTGDLIADGRIQFTGYSNVLWGQRSALHMLADSEDGLLMTASNLNQIRWADVYVTDGNITLAGVNNASNLISGSTLDITEKGDVRLYGGAYGGVSGSKIGTADGEVSLTSKELYVENSQISASSGVVVSGSVTTDVQDVIAEGESISVGSESSTTVVGTSDNSQAKTLLDALESVSVTGANVTVYGETKLNSQTSLVSVTATGADGADTPSLLINEAELAAETDVNITSEQGTASVMNADIKGEKGVLVSGAVGTELKSTTILESGAVTIGEMGATSVDNSTIAASGEVKIGGASVEVTNNSGISSTGSDINIAASSDQARVVGGTISATAGVAGISAAQGTATVEGVAVGGKSASITGAEVVVTGGSATATDGAVRIAGSATGTTVTGATVDGTTVFVGLETASTTISDATKVDATGEIQVSGTDVDISGGSTLASETGSVSITASTGNAQLQGGGVTAAGDVQITAGNINEVVGTAVTSSAGKVLLNGESNLLYNGITVAAARGVSITSTGMAPSEGNRVSDSVIETEDGDVVMTSNQLNAVTNSVISTGYVEGKGNVIIGDEGGGTGTVTNRIVATDGQMMNIFAGQNVSMTGQNVIQSGNFGGVSIAAALGDITLNGDNDITYAVIDAVGGDGDVAITTGIGDKGTTITNSGIYGKTVTIAGDTTARSDDNLAVVTGGDTRIASRAAAGVGLTLNNVFVLDTEKGKTNIYVMKPADIAILNRVDLQNGTLTIKNGANSDGRIVVDTGNVLNIRAASSLEGRLTGAGDINKSGGDSLLLDYDHSEFSGSIYANGAVGGAAGSLVDAPAANAGSWVEINGPGVGAEASIVLKNTDLVIRTDETQIGTLDTTQDSDANASGTGYTLLTNGSYTDDENSRRDFTMIGSVVEVNKGVVGDVVKATDLQLSDATLIKLDAAADDAGQLRSDVINAGGMVDVAATRGLNNVSPATAPGTARLYVEGQAGLGGAAEGARTTVLTGTMVRGINEDVLYEVQESANGTYQRILQDRNMHLENSDEGVELVISRNYRSCAKDSVMQGVAKVIADLSDDFHHTEGTLAGSSNTLERLVDAFDYTRSEASAQAGLKSLVGQGHVLPMLMLYDASRHHLNQLRRQMEIPLCKRTGKGVRNRASNAWAACTAVHDTLAGDHNLGDYTRSANGALMGIDTSVRCNWRLGFSLGYETSTGDADSAEVDADAFFVDAYAAGVTGNFKHRASIGLGFTTFESDRQVFVDAGYHSFAGKVDSGTDAISLNLGYEISSDYRINERSSLSRYLAVNFAWHKVDDSEEKGMAGLGSSMEYDKEWQADVALGVSYNRSFAAVSHQNSALFYANAAVHAELLNDQSTATGRFSNVAWESRSMKRDAVYFELGAGVAVPLSPAWTASAGAAVELGSKRTSISGNVGIRYSF